MSPTPSDLPPLPPDDEIPDPAELSDLAPSSAVRPKRSSGGLGLLIAVVLGGISAVGAFFGIKASGLLDPPPVADSPTPKTDNSSAQTTADDTGNTGAAEIDSSADSGTISIPGKGTETLDDRAPVTENGEDSTTTTTDTTEPVVEPAQVTDSTAPPSEPKTFPRPTDAALAAANATLDEVYGKRIREAREFEEKSALAQSLLDASGSETPGSPLQFAMLDRASRLAVDAAHPALADEIIAALGATFEIDLISRRADAVSTWSKLAFKELKGDAETAMQRVLAQRAARVAGEAWSLKRFDIAEMMFQRAEQLRDAAGDRDVARSFTLKKSQSKTLARLQAAAEAAFGRLESDPENAELNLAAGLAYAAARNWDRACDCFSKGSDDALKLLAADDRRIAIEPDGALAAGDLWWDAAASADSDRRDWMQRRALEYYESVATDLRGLQREKVVGRMMSVGPVGFVLPEPMLRFTFDRSDVAVRGSSGTLKNKQGEYGFGVATGGTRVDGAADEALHFNGLNHNVYCPGTEQTVGPQDSFTLATFLRIDAYGDYNIAGKFFDLFSETSRDFGLRMNRSGTITAVLRGQKGWICLQDTADKFPLGSWHHLAMTWDGAALVVYVDGFPAKPGRINHREIQNLSARYPFAVGGRDVPRNSRIRKPPHLNGALDETRLYLEALSPSMILHLALGTEF